MNEHKEKKLLVMLIFSIILTAVLVIDTEAADTSILFEKYYEYVLATKYGTFPKKQTGTMHQWDEKWMKIKGVMGARVMDYDMDGQKEMLVFCAEPLAKKEKASYMNTPASKIMMKMYEFKNGKMVLSSQMRFLPYYAETYYTQTLMKNMHLEVNFIASEVKKDNQTYIVCEEGIYSGAFANGEELGYWMVQYKEDKFQYVSSFTQPGPASSGFEYNVFTFDQGRLVNQELYYSEDGNPAARFREYPEALKNYFAKYGIETKKGVQQATWKGKSVLAKSNKAVKIFHFRNVTTYRDYDFTSKTPTYTYKFKAKILTKNKF